MKDLLPYFEAELAQMRTSAKQFAADYPRIASRLMLGNDAAEDPHVERLIQSFALLAARVHKRLDDDFPLFTESFIEVLYPHYLRPFPSCSIAQFDIGSAAGQISMIPTIERGTQLHTRPVRGVECRFRTAYDIRLQPIELRSAKYQHTVAAYQRASLPMSASATLSLQLEIMSAQVQWSDIGQSVRVYLNGDSSLVSLLREMLCNRVVAVMLQTSAHSPWVGPFDDRPKLVGFEPHEALIDYDERSHPAYRLLTEYFAFPDKFNFIDLPLPARAWSADPAVARSRMITLHFVLGDIRSDSDEARLLENISEQNFSLHCSPVVNLFEQNAEPIRITHTATQYPVVVSSRSPFGHEVYSIDKVFRVKQTPQGESIDEFKPFFSLQHDDLVEALDAGGSQQESLAGRYWHAQRDEAMAVSSPGYETEISIVDSNFNPTVPQTDTLSIKVTATNRDLPHLLSAGNVGGDLFIPGGSIAREIRLLRRPTSSCRIERGRGNLWRLISHLSLNHLSLSGQGIHALREILRLYDLPRDAANRRQIDGLESIEFKPATAWLTGQPFSSFVRGTEIRLSVDEDSFVGSGLSLFTAVLDRFFGLYVHLNSFVQLTVVSSRTQKPLIKCPPRNGDLTLV